MAGEKNLMGTQKCSKGIGQKMTATEIKPIFIVGAERSGTTLFRLMLDHHPEITVIPEFEYIVDMLPGTENWPSLDVFHSYLYRDRIFLAQKFSIDPSLDYPALGASFLHQQLIREKKPNVLAVVHRNFDQLKRIWPSARYIHIVRDPRDVARSCIHMGWAGNVWTGVDRWIDAENTWRRLKKQLSPCLYFEVAEELLIADPEKILHDISDFIGVDYHRQMLEYAQFTSYSKPDPTLIYQWKQKLTSKEIQLVESKAGALLTDAGYQPSGLPLVHPPWVLRLVLRVQDKISRIRYRLGYMGIKLFVSDWLSRKFQLMAWQDKLRPRIHEAGRGRLK